MPTYRYDNEHNGIEIVFNVKPPQNTLALLSNKGWHWHRAKKCWYAKRTSENLDFAKLLCNGTKTSNFTGLNHGEVLGKHGSTSEVPRKMATKPSSIVLSAKLCEVETQQASFDLTIVSDVHEQNSSENICWIGRALSAAAVAALRSVDRCLMYKGSKYQITDYVTYKDTEKYLKIISRFSNPEIPQTIYVFSQKNITHFEQDNYEMVTAMIPCANRTYPVPVSIYYDKEKQQYFINEATYTTLRQSHGLPYLRLRVAAEQGTSQKFAALRPHSELNLLGYNVNVAEGLSPESRRKILRDAIDSGVLWKSEVVNHLEWLINTMGAQPYMENAVGEWRSDLMYISQYKAVEQRIIWVNTFKSRFSETITL